ncbi:response regulator transcription factor [Mycoplasma sp. SG1]|uniref:response regulator transcription factor n=1 Tax=Mycoplasma sp. SG1 TaxID=2810348 RepID=UPI002023BD1F|nr:response regulator transcription factor [Mycoplasma sp. SG1]URM52783.1 response regulator transcription factor [Mycoplasma sp. SG1]
MDKLSVLFLDDDYYFLSEIKQKSQKHQHFNFSFSSTIENAISLCRANYFDLIIIDVNLSYESGFQFYKWLKKNKIDSKIIFITAFFLNEKVEEKSLKLEVYDFFRKPISWTALKYRLLRFYKEFKNQQLTTNISIKSDDLNHHFIIEGKKINFTKKEYRLFLSLIENQNQILSRKYLASLFDEEYVNTSRSLDVMISQIKKKIINFNDLISISSVYKKGYQLIINDKK